MQGPESSFSSLWHQAAVTSFGLFWTAFWAFGLGYLISSMIQVFVTRERMRRTMGKTGAKSIALGTFFGFISSSCSFAALATTRALFSKGAGLIPSLAFLLASTNLVIELGIVIAIFLSWQFVVGEYAGGLLLIALTWLIVRSTASDDLVERARRKARTEAGSEHEDEPTAWKDLITSREGWRRVAHRYAMEWKMVWKDVTIGFAVAGAIAVFVPRTFFRSLFVGAGAEEPAFWQVVVQTFVGPVAAFFTFIGSMGNIPLAAVLFGNGVSFAGIMAFIFSDLVVFPVLRIQARYYGWRMALYILCVFLTVLVTAALVMHYGFAALGMLPSQGGAQSMAERTFFAVDYTFFLNLAFGALTLAFVAWKLIRGGVRFRTGEALGERLMSWSAVAALVWLSGGLLAG